MAEIFDTGTILSYQDGDYSLEREIPVINESEQDTMYVVKSDDETLQSIAFSVYGDSSRWYVIAEANNIMNPFTELVPGLKLRIPIYGLTE